MTGGIIGTDPNGKIEVINTAANNNIIAGNYVVYFVYLNRFLNFLCRVPYVTII